MPARACIPDPASVRVLSTPPQPDSTKRTVVWCRCLEWLEENAPGQRVLDYGSGSGILGLAALKFGAKDVRHLKMNLAHPE